MEDKNEIHRELRFHWRLLEKVEISKTLSFASLFLKQNDYKMYVYEILRSFRIFHTCLSRRSIIVLLKKKILCGMLSIIWLLSFKVGRTYSFTQFDSCK